MGKPKAPPAPDYAAAAQQQGAANIESARLTNQLNRPNEITPWGSRTWSRNGDDWTSTITLDPAQQELLNGQNEISKNLLNTGIDGLNRIRQSLGQDFNFDQVPERIDSVYSSPMIDSVYSSPMIDSVNSPSTMQMSIGDQAVQRNLSTAGLTDLPGVNDFSADRQRVQDAVMSRANVDLGRQEDALKTQLANQGITPGSEAWKRAMDDVNRARVDASMQAILAGGQEQSRLFGMGSQARAQQFGERQAQGNFRNQSAGQAFNQNLARAGFANQAAGQQFGQNLAGANFTNQARGQQFGQNLAGANFTNQARGQQFGQNMSSANFQNQNRQQAIAEQAYLRSLPLNELNALRTGSQVNAPQFQPYFANSNVNAAPIFQGAQAQGQWDMANYGNQTGMFNNMMSGLFGIGSAMAGRR